MVLHTNTLGMLPIWHCAQISEGVMAPGSDSTWQWVTFSMSSRLIWMYGVSYVAQLNVDRALIPSNRAIFYNRPFCRSTYCTLEKVRNIPSIGHAALILRTPSADLGRSRHSSPSRLDWASFLGPPRIPDGASCCVGHTSCERSTAPSAHLNYNQTSSGQDPAKQISDVRSSTTAIHHVS